MLQVSGLILSSSVYVPGNSVFGLLKLVWSASVEILDTVCKSMEIIIV